MIDEDTRKDSSPKEIKPSSKSTRAYVSNLICRDPLQEDFDARKILDENPEVRNYHSLVLDLAYEEYCRKLANGDNVEQHSFVKRFPEIEDSLLRILQVHKYFAQEKSKQKAEWPKPSDQFGDYHLLELIGKGKFAYVFVAEQLKVAGRKVVLKITRDPLDEIEALSRLDHPNIVPIFTVESSVDGFTAICMPLISRVTLFDLLDELHGDALRPELSKEFICELENYWCQCQQEAVDRQPFSFPRVAQLVDAVIQVGIDIANALKYSHERGVLHCDIKPTNILISPEGKSMLFDFNLSAKPNSKTARICGTLPYMSPEQLQALVDANYDFEATKAVDLFSFGATIYQLLTGKLPWADINKTMPLQEAAKFLLQKQRCDKVNFDNVKGLNSSFKRIIESCLAFDPNDRPNTADEVASLLLNETNVFKRTQRRAIKTPVKTGAYFLLLLSIIPIAIIGFNYFSGTPTRLVLDCIEQGKGAESCLNFSLAISQYELALKRAAANQKLRFQSLCHLAIAYARHGKEKDSQLVLSALKNEFGKSDNLVNKIELALICSRRDFSRMLVSTAGAIRDTLNDRNDFSVGDRNNYWAACYRFKLTQRDPNFDQITSSFRELVEACPDHFETNLNLFRIQRRQLSAERIKKNLRYSMLLRCIKTRGDTPYVISLLFNKVCQDINHKKADAASYLALVDRFAACGGKRSLVESALWNIQNVNERKKILDGIKNHIFLGKDTDLFEIYGVTNPLNSHHF